MKFLPLLASLLTSAVLAATLSDPAAVPTFSKDVAPILYKNCASCHRPGEIAPMSLLTYEEARPWAAIHQGKSGWRRDASLARHAAGRNVLQRPPP